MPSPPRRAAAGFAGRAVGLRWDGLLARRLLAGPCWPVVGGAAPNGTWNSGPGTHRRRQVHPIVTDSIELPTTAA